MRRFAFWLSILVPALAVVAGACWGSFPLGVPGEWAWDRMTSTEPVWMSIGTLAIGAALYLGFVWMGARSVEGGRAWELPAWIAGLVACGFTWLWIAQEAAPDSYQLSKAVWVLYFRGSSGYFTEASDQAGDVAAYLAGYERKMAQGDVLHIGTHPPGLTVALRGLLAVCRECPAIADAVLATQPESVRAAFSAVSATSNRPQPLPPPERAVLWLAALLVQSAAALTIVPLFGLLRMTCSRRASWLAVAFWPTVPALAIFLPKADCLYPLLAATFLWLWLTALERRSRALSILAGLVLWLSLTLTLAFLPIALVALLAGCWMIAREPLALTRNASAVLTRSASEGVTICPRSRFGFVSTVLPAARQMIPFAAWGTLGFAVPCVLTAWFLKLNLLRVWWLNFQNHAAFYNHYPRTWWKWLLVNPVELAVAAGAPLTVLAIWSIVGRFRKGTACGACGPDWTWLVTLGLLWLSGKNMGEAARLWILLMPFLIWSAGLLFELPINRQMQAKAPFSADQEPCLLTGNSWCIALAVQFMTTAAIVTRVAGFDYPITGS